MMRAMMRAMPPPDAPDERTDRPSDRRAPRDVVVAGATGTVGRAVAEALIRRGDRVRLVARRVGPLDAFAGALGPGARAHALDLAAEGGAERLAEVAGDATDLVFAVGSFPRTPLASVTRAQLAAQVVEHCALFVEATRALAPALARAAGAAIAFGDRGVEVPYPNHLAYLAAKGALTAAARALSYELRGAGPSGGPVRVGVVGIGVVTDPELDDPARAAALSARSRLGRTGRPEEVAQVALAMLDATWVSGEVWHVG